MENESNEKEIENLIESILMPPPLPKNLTNKTKSTDYFQDSILQKDLLISKEFYTFQPFCQKYPLDLELQSTPQTNLPSLCGEKIILEKNFPKKKEPNTDEEIKTFVDNLIDYLNYYAKQLGEFFETSNAFLLKIKIETRFEDYSNNAIDKNYFVHSLLQMQKELMSMISMYNHRLIENV